MGCRSARLGAPAPGTVRGLAHDPTEGRGLTSSTDDRMTAWETKLDCGLWTLTFHWPALQPSSARTDRTPPLATAAVSE